MKTFVRIFTLTMLFFQVAGPATFSQVSITTDGSAPHASSMLDVKSTTRGVLFPRMSQSEMNAIAAPQTGLMVFSTGTNLLYYHDSQSLPGIWSPVSLWNRVSATVGSAIHYPGNIGIGSTAPVASLCIGSSNQFRVNSTGNILRINNVATSFPAAQGAANTVLQNDGAGNLTWAAAGGINRVVRGTYVTDATTFTVTHSLSPGVDPSKCIVEVRWSNTVTPSTKTNDLVVTALTSTTISFRKGDDASERIVEYQIIEYK